jgi:hypothetical protein
VKPHLLKTNKQLAKSTLKSKKKNIICGFPGLGVVERFGYK